MLSCIYSMSTVDPLYPQVQQLQIAPSMNAFSHFRRSPGSDQTLLPVTSRRCLEVQGSPWPFLASEHFWDVGMASDHVQEAFWGDSDAHGVGRGPTWFSTGPSVASKWLQGICPRIPHGNQYLWMLESRMGTRSQSSKYWRPTILIYLFLRC